MRRIRNHTSVSHAPFATVGRKGKCPSCGWSPPEGGVAKPGIRMSLRIHCYREHGLRLTLGNRQHLPPVATSALDLDAEVASHLWVVESALEQFSFPRDEVVQEARMTLMVAILMWDRLKCASFYNFARTIIWKRVCRVAKAKAEVKPVGRFLRFMLPQPLDPADTPVTPTDVAEAMHCLSDKQRWVLERLYRENPMTLAGIGKSIGLSKESVRQIKLKALRCLRVEIMRREASS